MISLKKMEMDLILLNNDVYTVEYKSLTQFIIEVDGKKYIKIMPQYATWYCMEVGHWTFIHAAKLFNEISMNMLTKIPMPLIKLIIDLWAPCLCYCQGEYMRACHYHLCYIHECTYCGGNLKDSFSVPSCKFHWDSTW